MTGLAMIIYRFGIAHLRWLRRLSARLRRQALHTCQLTKASIHMLTLQFSSQLRACLDRFPLDRNSGGWTTERPMVRGTRTLGLLVVTRFLPLWRHSARLRRRACYKHDLAMMLCSMTTKRQMVRCTRTLGFLVVACLHQLWRHSARMALSLGRCQKLRLSLSLRGGMAASLELHSRT